MSQPAPPLAAATYEDTLAYRTGAWRYLKPRFVRRLAPCAESCPAGSDPAGWLALAGQGLWTEALELLLEENPLPGVCGRVCPHPCQTDCNRGRLDQALSIRALERHLADHFQPRPPRPRPVGGKRVAVIGSGPAGLSGAYHLARLGHRVTLFEREAELGGLLRRGIPAYRLPREVLDREIERILAWGVEVRAGCRAGQDQAWEEILDFEAVLLAVGAWRSPGLDLPGLPESGARPGLEFLGRVSSGAPPDLSRTTVVIGGGNTALDCARTALRLGSRAIILYRRTQEEMPAIAQEIAEAGAEGVELITQAVVKEAKAPGGRLQSLVCLRTRPGPPGPDGRRRPEPVPGSEFTIPADSLLTALGETVDPADLPPGLAPDQGTLAPLIGGDPWGRCGRARVFAAGDASGSPRLVAQAIGSGKRAALGIHLSLIGQDPASLPPEAFTGQKGSISLSRALNPDPASLGLVPTVVGPEEVNLDLFEPREGLRPAELDSAGRVSGFGEIVLGLGKDQAQAEAGRCFNCGRCDSCGRCAEFCPDLAVRPGEGPALNRIEAYYCKGCGICAEECPRAAVIMEVE